MGNVLKSKVKSFVAILCGSERTNWLNPHLAQNLLAMSYDPRFTVHVHMAMDKWPVDFCRNYCVAQARDAKAEYLLMCDNDQHFNFNPLDVLANAGGKDVIGFASMQGMGKYETGDFFVPNLRTLEKARNGRRSLYGFEDWHRGNPCQSPHLGSGPRSVVQNVL